MYRRMLLSALLGLTLTACVPYYDGGQSYYRSEVYTSPAPAYYYGGGSVYQYRRDYYPAPRYYTPAPRYYSAPRYYQPAPRYYPAARAPATGLIQTPVGVIVEGMVAMTGATEAIEVIMDKAAAVTAEGPE